MTRQTEFSWTPLSNFSNLDHYVPFHFYETHLKLFPSRSQVQTWCFPLFFLSLGHPQNSSDRKASVVELYSSHIDCISQRHIVIILPLMGLWADTHTLTFPLDVINAILIFSDLVQFTTNPSITTEWPFLFLWSCEIQRYKYLPNSYICHIFHSPIFH